MTTNHLTAARLRLLQRRLHAAARSGGVGATLARGYLQQVRAERRRRDWQQTPALFGPNWLGPAVDAACRHAVFFRDMKGGPRHAPLGQ